MKLEPIQLKIQEDRVLSEEQKEIEPLQVELNDDQCCFSLEEKNDTYTNKSVMECCNHDVKDVCVDELVISTDTILFDDGDDELAALSTSSSSSDTEKDEKNVFKLSLRDVLKSLEENCPNTDILEHSDTDNDSPNEESSPVSNEVKCSEENAGQNGERAKNTEEQIETDISCNGLSYNSQVESGSIIFNFYSSTEEQFETDITCSDHDLKVSQKIQRDHGGESSFAPLSGSIICSGPAAYSGSLSIRSDSTVTSNRSFAFPILATEWNSSPVRMVKPDRRRRRRHRLRGWRQGLLCCRF